MASEIIPCPACKHPVRVPESLFGQAVRCPECKAYFTAPTRDAAGQFGEPILLADPPAISVRQARPKVALSNTPLFIPGLFLLLVGLIGTLVNGFQAVQTITDPEAAQARSIEAMRQFATLMKQEFNEDEAKKQSGVAAPMILIAAGFSIVPLLGAVSMLRMRRWGLAVTGSVIAIVNFSSCCCIIGLPVGIYCLVKLFDPDIREAFQHMEY